jgi:phosphate starvation-inducible PhoH-like protein
MMEKHLSFEDPEQIMQLFGPRDQFLRRIRDVVGGDIFLRGDQVTFRGTDEQIRRGQEVFRSLQDRLTERGKLNDDDLEQALNGSHRAPVRLDDAAIDLFEKARKITPRTPGQAAYVQTVKENELVFCIGPAGCGKTYLAVAMALHALRLEQVKKIVLVRPAVEAGEKLGFLPGDLLAKVNPFLRPLLDALHDMLDHEQVTRYMERDVIEIVPLAFMRGRTLNNTFIILDEGQNTTITQMKMFLTRMGQGSRIVVTGDITQIDLPPLVISGLTDAVERLSEIQGIAVSRLTGKDIVRHRLVKEIVKAYEPMDNALKGHRKQSFQADRP